MKKEAIVLKYSSTRGNAEQLDSAKAIIRGLAADGGLFVPDAMPQVDMAFIEGSRPCRMRSVPRRSSGSS